MRDATCRHSIELSAVLTIALSGGAWAILRAYSVPHIVAGLIAFAVCFGTWYVCFTHIINKKG